MNWAETPKPQFLYLHNGSNKRNCVIELEKCITYKMLSTILQHRKCPKILFISSHEPLLFQRPLPTVPSIFSPLSSNFIHLSQSSLKTASFRKPSLINFTPLLCKVLRVGKKSRSPVASPQSLQGGRCLVTVDSFAIKGS